MNTQKRTEIFETASVKKAVTAQTVPAVVSQMIALIYNLADTYFVGMLNSPQQTAAMTVAYPFMLMLTAISNLFGIGGASVIARSLGIHDEKQAKAAASVSFYCGLFSALLFSLITLVFARPLLLLCGAKEDTYAFVFSYIKWVVIVGGAGGILNTLMANIIRAEGSAVLASICISAGGIVNIVLDPIFILPQFLNLGAEGAGMATAISSLLPVLIFMIYALHKDGIVNVNIKNLKHTSKYIKEIISVGFPSALQYALTVVAVAAQASFVSKYTTEAVAALGIVKKLDQLPLYFSIGVANGILPLLAYNYSSGNNTRRREVFRFGCAVSLGFSLLCLILYEAFAPQIVSLFMKDAVTVRYAAAFLRIMVTAMPMMSICYPMIVQFQAMGKVRAALTVSVLRKGVLDIPLLYIMNALIPLYGCMAVQPIVDGISLAAASLFYKHMKNSSDCSGMSI